MGTPLEFALRDLGLTTVIVSGCVAEIGVEPTVRHGADLGFLPIVIADGCGSLNEANHQRVMESLRSVATVTDSATLTRAWQQKN